MRIKEKEQEKKDACSQNEARNLLKFHPDRHQLIYNALQSHVKPFLNHTKGADSRMVTLTQGTRRSTKYGAELNQIKLLSPLPNNLQALYTTKKCNKTNCLDEKASEPTH